MKFNYFNFFVIFLFVFIILSSTTLSCTNFAGAISGNATSATLSTNVVGAANRILFNSATNTTATSDNLNYNDSTGQLTGTNLNINVQDNKAITAGTGNDLLITHDGTDSYVRHINSGLVSGSELRIQSAGNLIFEAFGGGNPNFIKCFNSTNNHVEIYYNSSKKLVEMFSYHNVGRNWYDFFANQSGIEYE